MAVKIRLQRRGSTHSPIHKIVVAECSKPRDGKFIEDLGTHNPQPRGQDFEIKVNLDRYDYWISVGAQPSDTVKNLIKRARKITEKSEKGEVVVYAAAAA